MSQIFRQFFDKTSSTYTYLLADLSERAAILIDTVQEQADREFETLKELKINKVFLLSTHIHADHVTGNAILKDKLGKQAHSVISRYYPTAKADIRVGEEDCLTCGSMKLNFLSTPGHTEGCLSIVDHNNGRVFTGDTLLIRGCGRTDFQGGDSEKLYESITKKLFSLPKHYSVYPAHDYKGRTVSSIEEEMELNPRLNKSKDEFLSIMSNLNLAYPKLIDIAVPANLNCGYDPSC